MQPGWPEDEAEQLRVAFDALLPLAAPAQQVLVLRSALKGLINTPQARRIFFSPQSCRGAAQGGSRCRYRLAEAA
jgi:hypothetical protein